MAGEYDNFDAEFDAFLERLLSVSEEACSEEAGEITSALRDRLDIAYPPASRPGEYPHRRKGFLRAGISFFTSKAENAVTTYIISERPQENPSVPWFLEWMERPYMTNTKADAETSFGPNVRVRIFNKLGLST